MTTVQDTAAAPAPAPVAKRRHTGRNVLVLLILGALAVAAFWYFVGGGRRPRLVLITSGDGAYWDPVIAGAEEAARDFDATLVVERVKSDPFVQADAIKRRSSERRVDGIAISPLNASIQANLLADVAGTTTLVTLDSDSPVTGRLCFVGTDNYAAGREVGENVRAAVPDGGNVVICLGNSDKENTQHRRQGLIDELLDRPHEPHRTPDPIEAPLKGERYTVIATLVDGSDPAKATQLVGDAIKKHPDVKCFVGLLGYSTPAILAALEQSGKLGQVKVVGFDVDERTLGGIDAGNVYATIMQDQFGCGYHAVRILAENARGVRGGLPLFQVHALPYQTIRKDNLADARRNGGAAIVRHGPKTSTTAPTTSTVAAAP